MNANRRTICTVAASVIAIGCPISVAAQQSLRNPISATATADARTSDRSHSDLPIASQMPAHSPGHTARRERSPITESELLSGVNLSDDQKAAIDRIHHEMKAKMEIVARDSNETPEQKSAMLEGLSRMQMRQVFDVLKPDQREEVRKKILAARSAARIQEKGSSEQKPHSEAGGLR